MFFRNLTLFRFPEAFAGLFPDAVADAIAGIPAQLAEHTLKPVGPLEMSSYGFIPPMGRASDALSHRVGDAVWITLGGAEKILPPAVINELLAGRLAELEEREGRRAGGRLRKQMKEELVHELMPRAFVRPVRVDAYFDLARRFIAVDASSRRKAESLVSHVRQAAGSFPALPLHAEVSPRGVLTGWLAGDSLPDGLALGEECELKDADDHGAVVRCQRQELGADEIARHLESGKQVTKLALTLDDHVSFVLGEDLVIRKLRFLDGALDQLDSTEVEDAQAELSARFCLQAAQVGRLFDLLSPVLKISDEVPA